MFEKQVLVVDLDGTLVKTDLLFESFWSVLSQDVGAAASSISGILRGKAHLKENLARHVEIDPSRLPYNDAVLQIVKSWRESGGRTALVTASDQKLAQVIADHLGLFDEVHGSNGIRNLKGRSKAEFLVQRFGAGQYSYAGDSRADLPVWKSAKRAITVGVPKALRKAVETTSSNVQHLEPPRGDGFAHVKALRPYQWVKNILIFLPAVATHDLSAATWLAALLAFIAFSLVASSVYVLNDLLDLAADRAHPRKRNRSLASGAIPLAHGTIMVPALLLTGFLFALAVGHAGFVGILAIYFVMTTAYSLSLKRMLVLDIVTLAGLYTIRILAGGIATDVPISVWMLAFSIFFFLSLAALKRQAELVDSLTAGRAQALGRGYHVNDLPMVSMMAIAAGYVAVLVTALYINSDMVQSLYSQPQILWGICPVLLYWVSRMVMIAHRGSMEDDPIVFAFRDRASQICGVLIGIIVVTGSLL